VVEAQLQNWEMLLWSAISRKDQKSQAVVDSDAIPVLMFPFVGDLMAVLAVAVFLFEIFF